MRRLLMAGIAGLVVACGVPLDAGPVPIEIEYELPEDVAASDGEDLVAMLMFLVRTDRLVPVTRDLPATADLHGVIDSLLDGPTVPEERSQLRTAIPPATMLLGVESDGSVAIVDLSAGFTSVGGEEELLAVAQFVLTLTSLPGIDSVGFRVEGRPTNVPLPSGALSEAPVTAEPYLNLLDLGDESG